MATKETAKQKFINSVTDPLAVGKMTDKLGTYLGITVSEGSAPVANWKKFTGKAGDYFEKLFANMKAAYGGR